MAHEYCIYCGNRLDIIMDQNMLIQIGWKCANEVCSNPKKEWTVQEHVENQNWSIIKLRELEIKINELLIRISQLEAK